MGKLLTKQQKAEKRLAAEAAKAPTSKPAWTPKTWFDDLKKEDDYSLVPGQLTTMAEKAVALHITSGSEIWIPKSQFKLIDKGASTHWIKTWVIEKKLDKIFADTDPTEPKPTFSKKKKNYYNDDEPPSEPPADHTPQATKYTLREHLIKHCKINIATANFEQLYLIKGKCTSNSDAYWFINDQIQVKKCALEQSLIASNLELKGELYFSREAVSDLTRAFIGLTHEIKALNKASDPAEEKTKIISQPPTEGGS